jgi:hypothetical protein
MGTFQSLVSIVLVHKNIVYTQQFSTVQEVCRLPTVGEGLDVLFWPVGWAGARAKACIFAKQKLQLERALQIRAKYTNRSQTNGMSNLKHQIGHSCL